MGEHQQLTFRNHHLCCVFVVFLLLLLLSLADLTLSEPQIFNIGTSINLTNPYWRRPGCHKVGHTRSISIPGCVKFNLSTNACRGFCMSYSIPSGEDLGAPEKIGLELTPIKLKEEPKPFTALNYRQLESASARGEQQLDDFNLHNQLELKRSPKTVGKRNFAFSEFNQQILNLPDAVNQGANLADKREVISVSQCCNMIQTEDVVVNLRCGTNEVRHLVFKSAKTCECLFCKHI